MEAAPLTLTPRRARIGERFGLPYFDGWLLARRARPDRASASSPSPSRRRDDVPGQPLYFAIRQAIYALIGIALMFAVAKIDYSRFREIRVGIYSLMIASICLVLVFGAAARGSRRWIELPYFRFQPSELAKLLLIVALAAFVIERTRRGTPHAPDDAHPGARPGPGGTRLPATRPRHGHRARGHHTRDSFPRRGALDALRGDRRTGGRSPSASSSSSPRPPACRARFTATSRTGSPHFCIPATIRATRAIRSTRA